eukprot:m.253663 g.253663  ORF g.253663 m.253663 type:complete len:189 (-) comp19136_c2_seq2:190-756(-)
MSVRALTSLFTRSATFASTASGHASVLNASRRMCVMAARTTTVPLSTRAAVVACNSSSRFPVRAQRLALTSPSARCMSSASDDVVFDVTAAEFDDKVIKAEGLIIVDFHAEWCGPCKLLGPALTKAVRAATGVKLAKVDIDANEKLAAKFNISSVPTVVAFKDGNAVDGFIGAKSPDQVAQFIEKNAA